MENLILGPMATLCHEAFRKIVEDFGGCSEYFTEMINSPALKNGGQWEKFYLINETAPEKMVWQLTGNDIDATAWACEEVMKNGGIGVDLNMGCCAPQIVRTGCGISWMLEENFSKTRELVSKCRKAVKNARLSAKIRLGNDDYTIEKLAEFCKMLENEGVDLITIHPRTKSEKYRTPAKWKEAETLSSFLKVPLILNGDIKDRNSFESAKLAVPSAKGFMIARAAAQKPWIFKELNLEKGESFEVDLLKTGLDFIEYLQIYQPKEFWKTRLQRFFAYYSLNFSFWHYAQSKLLNAFTPEDAKKELQDYFVRQPSDQFKVISN